jgi:hypothetical protein
MNPTALVPNVRHLEEVFVHPCFLAGCLKEGFMSARRARGDDYALKFVLFNRFLDLVQAIATASIHVLLGIGDTGEGSCIFHDGWDIHICGNINAATANENSDPR